MKHRGYRIIVAGELIDLAELRERHRACNDSEVISDLIDALEAALNVKNPVNSAYEHQHAIAEDVLATVRQAAGVIEEDK